MAIDIGISIGVEIIAEGELLCDGVGVRSDGRVFDAEARAAAIGAPVHAVTRERHVRHHRAVRRVADIAQNLVERAILFHNQNDVLYRGGQRWRYGVFDEEAVGRECGGSQFLQIGLRGHGEGGEGAAIEGPLLVGILQKGGWHCRRCHVRAHSPPKRGHRQGQCWSGKDPQGGGRSLRCESYRLRRRR